MMTNDLSRKRSHDTFARDTPLSPHLPRATDSTKKPENSKRRNHGGSGESLRASNIRSHNRGPADGVVQDEISEELYRIKAQHRALTSGIVGALSRETLEELLVDAALEYPSLMGKIIVKNSEGHRNAPIIQRERERERDQEMERRMSEPQGHETSEPSPLPANFKFVPDPEPAYP